MLVSWGLFYAFGTDGGQWIALSPRVFKANSNNWVIIGPDSVLGLIPDSLDPESTILDIMLYCTV